MIRYSREAYVERVSAKYSGWNAVYRTVPLNALALLSLSLLIEGSAPWTTLLNAVSTGHSDMLATLLFKDL